MNNELAKTIIDWHFQQAIETIELEQTFAGSLIDANGDFNDINEISRTNEFGIENPEVLGFLDCTSGEQQDDRELAQSFLDDYDESKDAYCVIINFDNDDFGNKQYYKYLIQ